MPDDHEQALAGLKVLVRFCWIDREIDPTERAELRGFAGLDLDDAALDAVLAEEIDLEEAVAAVTDDDVRAEVLESARRVAREHRSTTEEEWTIAKVRDTWGFPPPEPDPEELKGRDTDITELTRRFMSKEATTAELVQKIREDLGED
jgi:hypothetical protein